MYHAAPKESQAAIEATGLVASDRYLFSDTWIDQDERIQGPGVFLFSDIEDAKEYGYLNHTDIVVFEIDTTDMDLVADPEYDEGEAWFFGGDIEPDSLALAYQTEEA